MSKKILAGVLAAASILSVSAVASAADETPGKYTITAGVTEGTVNVTLPTADAVQNGIFLNPYEVNVGTAASGKNSSQVASAPFEILNDADAEDPVKVMATVSVTKATGVVVKDMSLDKKSVKGWDSEDVACDAVDNFNPLVDYTAIKTTTTTNEDKTKTITYASGGDKVETAKQKKNIGIWLAGGAQKADVIEAAFAPETDGCVPFLPKGTNSGTLITSIDPAGKAYFAVNGAINPEYKGEWDTTKDSVQMTIIIKCMPTKAAAPVTP